MPIGASMITPPMVEMTWITLESQLSTYLITWRPEASRNFPLTTKFLFKSFRNRSSPINYDDIIDDFEDELVMIEDDLDRRPMLLSSL